MDDLFALNTDFQPLAARMRPKKFADYIGQSHIISTDKPLRKALESGAAHSMILWGPPMCSVFQPSHRVLKRYVLQ